jgi:serine/threonine protein kinase
MGLCSSTNGIKHSKSQSQLYEKSKNLENYEMNSKNTSLPLKEIKKKRTKKMLSITNRISNKTNIDDINKTIKISEHFLGKGLTGVVRTGSNSKGELFAIKSIWKADVAQNEFFKQEIEISLMVENDNIVKCYEIYEDNSFIHFVLELLQGGDLFDHIINSPNRKLDENEVIELLFQMLQALRYLHYDLKVCHRDIKPENFLLINKNGKNIIKLIDFGFATFIPENGLMNDLLGTPQYAAPEIYKGIPYTTKVDLWSIGIVLYNMINGTHPFNFNNGNQNLISNEVLNKPINFEKIKNTQLRELAQNLLERNPEKRFNVIQALSALTLMRSDPSQNTIPSEFNPNIKKIIFILNNDNNMKNEINKLFIKYLDMLAIDKIYRKLCKKIIVKDDKDMLSCKLYQNVEELIEEILKIDVNEEFKKNLICFKNNIDPKKLKTQLINVNRLLNSSLSARKFLHKQRVLNEFKKYDKKNKNYLTYEEIKAIFNAPAKQQCIKDYKEDSKIYFEDFYLIFNDYHDKKIPILNVFKRTLSNVSSNLS